MVHFRAAQKLNLSSSPHRRRRSGDENIGSDEQPIFPNGYAALLLKSPPPAPPALLRRIGVKELTGVGKVSCHHLSNTFRTGRAPPVPTNPASIRQRGEDSASSPAVYLVGGGKPPRLPLERTRHRPVADPPPIFHRIGFHRLDTRPLSRGRAKEGASCSGAPRGNLG